MNPLTHSVIIFTSLHDVMAAEKTIMAQDITCELIPTPCELSSNCGMALEVQQEDLLMTLEAIAEKDICYHEIYLELECGYRKIDAADL